MQTSFYDDIYIGKDIDKTALIYYAPSTGALSVDYVLSDEQIMWFQKFKNYSARDVVTKNLLKIMNIKKLRLYWILHFYGNLMKLHVKQS